MQPSQCGSRCRSAGKLAASTSNGRLLTRAGSTSVCQSSATRALAKSCGNPCDDWIVDRAEIGRDGDDRVAVFGRSRDDQLVACHCGSAAWHRQLRCAEGPFRGGRQPAARHGERKINGEARYDGCDRHDCDRARRERRWERRERRLRECVGRCSVQRALRVVRMCQRVSARIRRSNQGDQCST